MKPSQTGGYVEVDNDEVTEDVRPFRPQRVR